MSGHADPAPPEAEQVLDGLWSIPVPIPGSPLPYVLAYAFAVPDGVVLVDPGWNAPEALAALSEGLAVAGARVEDVRGVLVTHIHPDHYGLAARIRELSGAWVGLHPADAALVTDRYRDVDDLLERTSRWVAQTGAPAADLAELRDASMALRRFVVAGQPDLVADGDRPEVPGWRLLALHTPATPRAPLLRGGADRGGAHRRPRPADHQPQRLPAPPGRARPAGRLPGLAGAAAAVRRRAGPPRPPAALPRPGRTPRRAGRPPEARLDEAQALVAAGAATIWEVATRLAGAGAEITGIMRRAALGETAAHLTHLELRGRLERSATPAALGGQGFAVAELSQAR